MLAREPIMVDGQRVGRVVVLNDLSSLWRSVGVALASVPLGSLLALLVSVGLARKIARSISRPISRLARTASAIASDQDYSQRLPRGGADEVGAAVNAFNTMLDALQQQSNALHELRVADRTGALRLEEESAEAASLAKSSFLSNMSHELRTPLNAVIGAAQLLDDQGMADQRQSELVLAIRDSGTRLLGHRGRAGARERPEPGLHRGARCG